MGVVGNYLQLKWLIVIGLINYVLTQDCLPERFLPLPQTTECYRPLDNTTECSFNHYACASNPDATTWTILSVTSGRVDVTFHLPFTSSCNQTRYEVELKVSDVPQEDCAHATDKDFYLTHTKPHHHLVENGCANSDRCPPVCTEEGVVSFQFVFTGCYQIVIQPKIGTHSRRLVKSCPQYLQTNYSKALLSDEIPTFKTDYHDQRRNSPVTIIFTPLTCNYLIMDIKLFTIISSHHSLGEACYKTGLVHSTCPLGPNQTSHCHQTSSELYASISECNVESDRVICVFSDISPGNYCVRMEIHDDRCDVDTLWTKNGNATKSNACVWQNIYQAVAGPSNNGTKIELSTSVDHTQSYITIGGILFTASILSAVAVCFCLKMFAKRRASKAVFDSLECPSTPVECSRILLLYARDCLPFMQLMATFRQLLEDASSNEVFDCFDSSRWPELSRNPIEWIRRLVVQRDTKIIVVATKCSSIRQQALLDNTIVRYQTPSSNDDLFVYALQTLMDNADQDMYKRIFVVRFEGAADDEDLFAHLNSYTRFVLPRHINKLIYNLNESIFSDQSIRLKESEVQSICQDLALLTSYMKQNDNYLQNMLTIQRSS